MEGDLKLDILHRKFLGHATLKTRDFLSVVHCAQVKKVSV